jgi:hypothetical protein
MGLATHDERSSLRTSASGSATARRWIVEPGDISSSPRLRMLSSNPWKRRWPSRTIFGSKLLLRSRDVLIATGPYSVASVFGVVPLRALPVPPGGSWWAHSPGAWSTRHSVRALPSGVRSADNPPRPTVTSGDFRHSGNRRQRGRRPAGWSGAQGLASSYAGPPGLSGNVTGTS